MKYYVRAVAFPVLASGFRLAGLLVDEVPPLDDATSIGEQLTRAVDRTGTGILLVEQSLLSAAPETLRRELEHRAVPMIVPVPAPVFAGSGRAAEDYILELLRRAIGYRVRFQ